MIGELRESLTYRRVAWPLYREAENIGNITMGSFEVSFDGVGASGSLEIDGKWDNPRDMLRIYYTATDVLNNTTSTECIGTFFTPHASSTWIGGCWNTTVDLESTLSAAAGRLCGRPYTVKADTNAVAKARELLGAVQLRSAEVVAPYVLASDMTFDGGESYLDIVNALLSAAGFLPCIPDKWGGVALVPDYSGHSKRPAWTFDNRGEETPIEPGMVEENDVAEAHNVVRLMHSGNDFSAWATAIDNTAGSKTSVAGLLREVSLFENISEISATSGASAAKELERLARERLEQEACRTETREISTPWVPVWVGETIEIDHSEGGNWLGIVDSFRCEITDKKHVELEFRARRNEHSSMDVQVESGWW